MDLSHKVKVIVFDAETTVQRREKEKDGSPFNPDNRLVSGHWTTLEVDLEDVFDIAEVMRAGREVHSSVYFHNEMIRPDNRQDLQAALDWADMFVAHNAKFDWQWLTECGFALPARVWDTMIGEYVFARGRKGIGFSLEDTAERRDVTRKKGDLVHEMFHKQGIGFEEMPLEIVLEYAEADVTSCAEIFLEQLNDLQQAKNFGLRPVIDLMNDMLLFVVEIEGNGICIDLNALSDVEVQFRAEYEALQKRLKEIAESVMGDTPINLGSGGDLSKVIYSREVTDKKLHKEMFRIGRDARGKPLYPPRMSQAEFAGAVRATTRVVFKTVVQACHSCKGRGHYWKRKQNGEPYKKPNKCPTCGGEGVTYEPTGQKAGLRLVPSGPKDAVQHGFATDKDTLKRLAAQAEDKGRHEAVEFLTKLTRLNAVSTYLSSFVEGIRFWTRPDGILHPNFNQTVAATGRLSSSKPNFQNQPKGKVFPVRKAVVSRFVGGEILEIDYSGLEFRVAGELSRDAQIIADILDGKDVHRQTASIIGQCSVTAITTDMRQGAKPHTFAPLYGGMGASEPEHVQKYYREFFNIYKGHGDWQKKQCDEAIKSGIIRIPSGREYQFDNVKRLRGGRVTNQTNIVNYPVQGFATADIVPLACVRALREFRRLGLKSLLILTVHDSIVVDVYPGEREQVIKALCWAMREIGSEMKERWNYDLVLPLDAEAESGPNWMTMEERELPPRPETERAAA